MQLFNLLLVGFRYSEKDHQQYRTRLLEGYDIPDPKYERWVEIYMVLITQARVASRGHTEMVREQSPRMPEQEPGELPPVAALQHYVS